MTAFPTKSDEFGGQLKEESAECPALFGAICLLSQALVCLNYLDITMGVQAQRAVSYSGMYQKLYRFLCRKGCLLFH